MVCGIVGDGLKEALVEVDGGAVAGLVEGTVVGPVVWVVSAGDCPAVVDLSSDGHGLFPPVLCVFLCVLGTTVPEGGGVISCWRRVSCAHVLRSGHGKQSVGAGSCASWAGQ